MSINAIYSYQRDWSSLQNLLSKETIKKQLLCPQESDFKCAKPIHYLRQISTHEKKLCNADKQLLLLLNFLGYDVFPFIIVV